MSLNPHSEGNRHLLYRRALALALITVFYNIAEGVFSVWFGLEDETLSLFGFGLDSFVEVVSGVGIWHMVRRQQERPDEKPDRFERTALRVTGTAFYILVAGLTATAFWNLFAQHHPETTFWGVVISLVSLSFMWWLIRAKQRVGRELDSPAILAGAECSRACMILSVVLLAASAGYELTGIGGLDALGALGIAWFSLREGREAFAEAKGLSCSCGGDDCSL
ncbi:MAG TPA: cation transporter [Syntrophales bacterium]|nr:cation transporter [Syntrophales bacterium]